MFFPNGMQATLVSHYGRKDEDLAGFIRALQDRILSRLKSAFCPYPLEQVHGTVIGLEGKRLAGRIQNQWFLENTARSRLVDVAQLLEFLSADSFPSIELQVGGWENRDYPFTSRDKRPWKRSFSVQGEIAVAMGWTPDASEKNHPVDDLRRSFNRLNVLHKWHKKPETVDDDFYFVLGRVQVHLLPSEQKDAILDGLAEDMREFLAHGLQPVTVTLSRESLSVVAYVDTQLPLATSCVFSVVGSGLGALELLELYPVL